MRCLRARPCANSNAKRTRETLDLLGKVFQYRTCDGAEPGRASGSPCLDYFIKRCQAPCVGYISKEDYRENIDVTQVQRPRVVGPGADFDLDGANGQAALVPASCLGI